MLPTSKQEGSKNRKRETALVEDDACCSQSSSLSSVLLGLGLKRGFRVNMLLTWNPSFNAHSIGGGREIGPLHTTLKS